MPCGPTDRVLRIVPQRRRPRPAATATVWRMRWGGTAPAACAASFSTMRTNFFSTWRDASEPPPPAPCWNATCSTACTAHRRPAVSPRTPRSRPRSCGQDGDERGATRPQHAHSNAATARWVQARPLQAPFERPPAAPPVPLLPLLLLLCLWLWHCFCFRLPRAPASRPGLYCRVSRRAASGRCGENQFSGANGIRGHPIQLGTALPAEALPALRQSKQHPHRRRKRPHHHQQQHQHQPPQLPPLPR